MLLQCRKCWKIEEHSVFKENGIWLARCNKCNYIWEVDISKFLKPIGTRFMTSSGRACEVIGYGNNTEDGATYEKIYYVGYPIECPQDEPWSLDKVVKVYTSDMDWCEKQYYEKEAIKEEKIMEENITNNVNNIEVYATGVDNIETLELILRNMLFEIGFSSEMAYDMINVFYNESVISGTVSQKESPCVVKFGTDEETKDHYVSYDNEKTKKRFYFYTANCDWDVINFLSNYINYIEGKNYKCLKYDSDLKTMLYDVASVSNIHELLEMKMFRDFADITEIILHDGNILRFSEEDRIHITARYDRHVILAKDKELGVDELFNPWLDILIDQKLR